MGFNKPLHVHRLKPFVDVSLVHSKTGYAILRGSSFYDRTLSVRVRLFDKNACVTARNIEHQQQQVINRYNRIMNRSEKLVDAYNLPPIKPSEQKPSSADSVRPSFHKSDQIVSDHTGDRLYKSLLKERHKHSNQDLSSSLNLGKSVVYNSLTDIRGTMSSPAPKEYVEDQLSMSTGCYSKPSKDFSGGFPAIMVQKCDTNSPRISRKNRSITDDMRTLSANNLYVPSPLVLRRHEQNDTQQSENLSRSEGCLNQNNPISTVSASVPLSAPVTNEKKRPGIMTAEEAAIEEFRKNREMYSPSTPRRPVRLIALNQTTRSQSTGDVNSKKSLF